MIATMLPALYAPLEGASMSFSPSSFDLIENDKSRNPKELCPHAVRGSRGSCVTSRVKTSRAFATRLLMIRVLSSSAVEAEGAPSTSIATASAAVIPRRRTLRSCSRAAVICSYNSSFCRTRVVRRVKPVARFRRGCRGLTLTD